MLLQLTDFSPEPLYRQLSRQLAEKIRQGDVQRLEPIRRMARGQHLSVNSVERAYNELLIDGLIERSQSNYVVSDTALSPQKRDHRNKPSAIKATDLNRAEKIQRHFLPAQTMNDKEVSIAACSRAKENIGGDMYDYFKINESSYGLVIGDACGHGIAAALLISQIQAIIKSEIKNGSSLLDTMQFINSHIRTTFLRGNFITLFYGIYDVSTGTLTYINAGHHFPILIRQNKKHEFLTNSSPALGLADELQFSIGEIQLNPGDKLCLYTDGITEAMNNHREEFGEERLLSLLKKFINLTPENRLDSILHFIEQFGSSHINTDDRTMMIFDLIKKKTTRCA